MLASALPLFLRFESRKAGGRDGAGNALEAWRVEFRARGTIRFLRGGEEVFAARIEGRQPAILTLNASDDSRRIEPSWRAVNEKTGRTWNIRAVTVPPRGRIIELLAESGVADG
jgi:head-tail adaptor